ncbi:hypothetical protein ABB37_05165 [Leptomonas pyrrhocoris]|uniref:Gamma tubulin complex component protein N-terminal domain-containing protein n=1 Tax=Leptomonas pyrrhocoris TaxID=157538 RepID=A0A0N0DVD0_LEPPY|nr:hypothetical protein ABB37_05165 [Leptomonas pyrrhocoris]KPA80184.1 hypothetical protein ABB37_05165 [Leptomonas pyrrhocoris]|eukprot:XP_015658623.1 hypothetical protein ABB37_05165 [Leptomonas pyrrhocoris]
MDNVFASPPPGLATGEPPLRSATTVSIQRRLPHVTVGAAPPLLQQPSVLNLLTALPLLLSLDHSDYTRALNNMQERWTLTEVAPPVRQGKGTTAVFGTRGDAAPHDTHGDAATTAVRAVLCTSGGSLSWQAQRRRMRRVALDAFFRASLPAQISARVGGSADAAATSGTSDGVHRATMRLLAHTRAVMEDVSPTQAQLVDLFAGRILRRTQDEQETDAAAAAAAGSGNSSLHRQVGTGDEGREGVRIHGPTWDGSSLQVSPRGIMKTSPLPATGAATRPFVNSAGESARSSSSFSSPSSIAEQLLYVILRTSIVANMPLRSDEDNASRDVSRDGFQVDGSRSKGSYPFTPPSQAAGISPTLLTFSPTNTPSSTGSLIREKPRVDVFGSLDRDEEEVREVAGATATPAALFRSSEAQSIRHHPAGVTRGQDTAAIGAVLPYEPQCWLGPSTVALVERSTTLRRQQRWTCDRDPVIEATVAGEGAELFHHAYARTKEGMPLYGRHGHWAPFVGAAWSSEDADALDSFVRDSGLPFPSSTTSSVRTARGTRPAGPTVAAAAAAAPFSFSPLAAVGARELRGASVRPLYATSAHEAQHWGQPRAGVLHWTLEGEDEDAEGSEADPSVRSLFEDKSGSTEALADLQGGLAAAAEMNSEGKKRHPKSEPSTMPLTLPACRTPFVACNALYDPAVYARVYVALHRCTAGLVDPYELTYCDVHSGPNLVEIRVRAELYAPSPACTRSIVAHSGLTSMLEWGCRCGTLLLRLRRLCAVADDATMRASLGSYGRSAMDTLRIYLCFLQRQVWELGDRVGGAHRLSFTELLTAQQRLQKAMEQVEVLAAFFEVPSSSAAAATAVTSTVNVVTGDSARAKAKAKSPVAWDPVDVLQQSCCSALLMSRLHELFTTRHANALGQHSNVITSYSELQQENLEEWMNSLRDGDTSGGTSNSVPNEKAASLVDFTADRQRQRKDLLSYPIDAIGLLLRATLRPFHAMLHRWLTAGELADPYDEFFVVPSHGQTHSGFTLDLAPQRLPVFVSAAAANDLLHAGVSLRVLRAAATHVVLSAQKDARRLQGLAEATEAAAEDYAEELLDTQTLQGAIQKFVERLVRGAPTEKGVNAMGRFSRGAAASADDHNGGALEQALPLPPRVDVLSAYGAINWWRQHYQACTQVLLEAVEDAAGAETPPADNIEAKTKEEAAEGTANADTDASSASRVDSRSEGQPPSPRREDAAALSAAPSPSSDPSHANKATLNESLHNEEGPGNRIVPPVLAPAGEGEDQSYITVFMNSDNDEDDNSKSGEDVGTRQQAAGQRGAPAKASPSRSLSSASSSAASTSVLGLRHIAGSRLSIGTAISSTASSRGTIALYGAITEELRQVSLLEQQTEARVGQSRHALRAEFAAQMWRRKREMRLSDWKAQRLSLRLRRVRAMDSLVEELREVYGIRGAGFADEAPVSVSQHHDNDEEEQRPHSPPDAALSSPPPPPRVVVPLRRVPPSSAPPPVLLYAENGLDEGERDGRSRRPSQGQGLERQRRTSFAATTTVIPPLSEAVSRPIPSHPRRRSSSYAAASPHPPRGILLPPRPARTRSASGPVFVMATLPPPSSSSPAQEAPNPAESEEAEAQNQLPIDVCAPPPRERWRGQQRSLSTPVAKTRSFVDRLPSNAARRRSAEEVEGAAATLASHPVSLGDPTVVHQLRDVDSNGSKTVDPHKEQEVRSGSSDGSHARALRLTVDVLSLYRNEESMGKETLQEQWHRTATLSSLAAVAGDEQQQQRMRTDMRVRRDELGYAHPDANYVVADINDDEFFGLRTGPKSGAKWEAESAALARLAAGRAALDRCTVDEPHFLRQLQRAAHADVDLEEDAIPRSETVVGEDAFHGKQSSRTSMAAYLKKDESSATHSHVRDEHYAEEDVKAAQNSVGPLQTNMLPSELSELWRDDDPLERLRQRVAGDNGDDEGDYTDRLWSWTPAEAHRWYLDHRVSLLHVLTGSGVDRALLVDLPLLSDEAEALQCCGGYYRALGQYTASFLTHKALQLTLLPPYGSLYRLTTQFLDVCLMQQSAVAVRIVDVWSAAVDAALEMMAEGEEAAMVQAVIAGATTTPAPLANLTDQQQGLNLKGALASLNDVFQQEWAACVPYGESTVRLEWKLSRETEETGRGGKRNRSAPASQRLGSTQRYVGEEEEGATEEAANADLVSSDVDNDDVLDGAAPSRGWHHRDDYVDSAQEGDAEEDVTHQQSRRAANTATQVAAYRTDGGSGRRSSQRSRASPIQSFLAALRLTAVSPWCSGAWLLPERTTPCLGGICRTLLFWKSVERVVLHTWRAGVNSGLSSVFFFCTTVRQVLLSTLQESLWGQLTERTATYRESLRFEAGVLYTYRALENFTADHEMFLQDCEFYTLCGPPFQSRVQPLLRAMMHEVELAERSLRFANVSIRVARRQYMATFHSMVSSSSNSSDDEDGNGSADASSSASKGQRQSAAEKGDARLHPHHHVFALTRWCRRGRASAPGQEMAASSQKTSLHLRQIQDAVAHHQQQEESVGEVQRAPHLEEDKKGSGNTQSKSAKDAARDTSITHTRETKRRINKPSNASTTTTSTDRGGKVARVTPLDERSDSAFSSTTTTNTNTAFSATAPRTLDEGNGNVDDADDKQHCESSREDEEEEAGEPNASEGGSSMQTTTTVNTTGEKKRRRRPAQAAAKTAPRRSIIESATMNTTPIYAAVLAAQPQRHAQGTAPVTGSQKRSRSAGTSLRQAPSVTAAVSPSKKRHREQQQQGQGHGRRRGKRPSKPRLTPAERQERRDKLRVIAERKIKEETEHQRRRMRDVVARRLRRFASLTMSLRDALSDIIAEEDLAAQEMLTTTDSNNNSATTVAAESAAAAKELQSAQRQRMSRFTYLSAMVRRLDSLGEVMASQT